MAEEAACVHGLDRVLFIPCFTPPHKTEAQIAPPHHRLEMTRIACKDNPRFDVSDMEIERQGTSYTVITLETLSRRTDCEPYFILGTDSLSEIYSWKESHRLFGLSNFICVQRPGNPFQSAWERVPESIRSQFSFQEDRFCYQSGRTVLVASQVQGLDVSSTRIRAMVKQQITIRYLVSDAVRLYMSLNNLYGSGLE